MKGRVLRVGAGEAGEVGGRWKAEDAEWINLDGSESGVLVATSDCGRVQQCESCGKLMEVSLWRGARRGGRERTAGTGNGCGHVGCERLYEELEFSLRSE